VQTFRIALRGRLIRDRQQVHRRTEQIAERLKQPGVVAVGLANMIRPTIQRGRAGLR